MQENNDRVQLKKLGEMNEKDNRRQRYNKTKGRNKRNKKSEVVEGRKRIKKIKVKDNNNKVIFYDPTIEDDTEFFL